MVNINDLISRDEMDELERLHDGLYWVEWFKKYPVNCMRDGQYLEEEWQLAFDKYGDAVVEIFMVKHGDTDPRILGPRLADGWYQKDLLNIINFLMFRIHGL